MFDEFALQQLILLVYIKCLVNEFTNQLICHVMCRVVPRYINLRRSTNAGLYQLAAAKHAMASLTDDHMASCPVDSTQPLKPFSEIPGPKGLPYIGTLSEYMKRNGLKFNKLFQVCILFCGFVATTCIHLNSNVLAR